MKKKISLLHWIIILIFFGIFIKSFFLHPTFSDENFYFNVARNIAQGKVPYKDFFFAHPPLQIYALALLYKIFSESLILGKFFTLILSSLSALLLFLIAREVSNESSAFFVSLLFLISPPWIAFSTISYGMWESMAFLLLSFYLFLKKRFIPSTIFFVLAFLFRYTAALYFPIFLLVSYLEKKRILTIFLKFFIPSLIALIFLIFLFGKEYIYQTLFYHSLKAPFQSKVQYFGMGTFFIFLALISTLVGVLKKDKFIISLALFPFFIDMALLLGLKIIFYHYFLLSVPFYLISFSRVMRFKYSSVILATLILLFISYTHNLQTFDYYLNPVHSKKFAYIANIVEKNTSKDNEIFGEPVMTNYVSFVTGRKIASDYFDSYIQRLKVEGVEKIVEILEKEKPKIFIEIEGYYSSLPQLNLLISANYYLIEKVKDMPSYLIYKLKD
jgi:Gpi18-like mannosyltransferase